jgi:hypothetical protein
MAVVEVFGCDEDAAPLAAFAAPVSLSYVLSAVGCPHAGLRRKGSPFFWEFVFA